MSWGFSLGRFESYSLKFEKSIKLLLLFYYFMAQLLLMAVVGEYFVKDSELFVLCLGLVEWLQSAAKLYSN